jgi:hypothetical protein
MAKKKTGPAGPRHPTTGRPRLLSLCAGRSLPGFQLALHPAATLRADRVAELRRLRPQALKSMILAWPLSIQLTGKPW